MTRALFLTPIVPAQSGNGLAMRAFSALSALAEVADVDVEVIGDHRPFDISVRALADTWTTRSVSPTDPIELARHWLASPRWRALASALLPLPSGAIPIDPTAVDAWVTQRRSHDLVHVVRVRTALAYGPDVIGSDHSSRLVLDLDDDEVALHRRLAARADEAGDVARRDQLLRDADAYGRLVDVVGAGADRLVAARPGAGGVIHVPNAVPGGSSPRSKRSTPAGPDGSPAVRLLFVGNLTYRPNIDAASLLVGAVAPDIARRSGRPVDVRLVGSPSAEVRRLADAPDPGVRVHVAGAVDDLDESYDWADATVVLVPASGGTCIKIIEALARELPVVANAIALDGLAVPDDVVWRANDAAAACDAVVDIVGNPDVERRTDEGRRWVRRHHDPTIVRSAWHAAFGVESR